MSETLQTEPDRWEPSPYARAVMVFVSALEKASQGEHGLLDKGDVAALRRMDVTIPAPAFWKLAAAGGEAINRHNETRWALVAKCMAIMTPFHHRQGSAPGAALRDAGFSQSSEIRITRLLNADDSNFDDYVTGACRYLAAKAKAVDWLSFARLLLERDDRSRNALARDFYSISSKDGDQQ